MEPTHEEDPQRESMGDQAQAGVSREPSCIDVSHQVIFKDGDAIVHVCTRLSVGKAIEEPSESYTFGFFVSFALFVLEVSKVLFSQLHFFLCATHHAFRQHATYALHGLFRPAIRRVVEEQLAATRHGLCNASSCFSRLCSTTQRQRHTMIRHFGVRAMVHVALRFGVSQQHDARWQHRHVSRHSCRRGGMVPRIVLARAASIGKPHALGRHAHHRLQSLRTGPSDAGRVAKHLDVRVRGNPRGRTKTEQDACLDVVVRTEQERDADERGRRAWWCRCVEAHDANQPRREEMRCVLRRTCAVRGCSDVTCAWNDATHVHV
mmetsp:Transcript_6309/g.39307  ORF Transcript_6309/g.39307 Transcript_6309/m.39307 type:complete len:320 (+) Transcript_6309:2074-3033(+)